MADLTAMMQAAAGAGGDANFIEDVFSTYLYTGNSSTQTITNGIDLAGEGGLVWSKSRSDAFSHGLYDTVRGATKEIKSDATTAQSTDNGVTAFNSDGYAVGARFTTNNSGSTYVSWTFRKQPKFFDVVTYTGNGTTNRAIPHNLGTTVGSIIIKCTSFAGTDWIVWHRGLGATDFLRLNLTSASATDSSKFSQAPTDTNFYVGDDGRVNASGRTYVAYLFAHDAGGFGLSGEDNVISCGSFTRTFGTANSVNLGYEPQWVLIKCTSQTDSWQLYDTMRGLSQTASLKLEPNSSNPDSNTGGMIPTATGFDITATGVGGGTFIYIAIRRGPMRVPETGTSVFSPQAFAGNGSTNTRTTNFPVDMFWNKTIPVGPGSVLDRLRGQAVLRTNETFSEGNIGTYSSTEIVFQNNTGLSFTGGASASDGLNQSGVNVGLLAFRRAPGFFDEVCYTGNSVQGRDVPHNLGVAPNLMIVKKRDSTFLNGDWTVYVSGITHLSVFGSDPDNYGNNPASMVLNTTAVPNFSRSGSWDHTHPNASVFRLGDTYHTNRTGSNYVNYLFATLAGISKVGSYTGTGTTQVINCGFTAGSRFIMIKRTDSTGNWYVWDSARGIVAGNDPYLWINSTAAEVTNTDFVDTAAVGFEISSTAPAEINASGGTYIFLAIA